MRFLVDAQLPPALCEMLISAGHDAEHVVDIGLGSATDSQIWCYALENNAVVVSKDQDFAERAQFGKRKTGVVWIRWGNVTTHVLKTRMTPLLSDIIDALEAGETLIEIV